MCVLSRAELLKDQTTSITAPDIILDTIVYLLYKTVPSYNQYIICTSAVLCVSRSSFDSQSARPRIIETRKVGNLVERYNISDRFLCVCLVAISLLHHHPYSILLYTSPLFSSARGSYIEEKELHYYIYIALSIISSSLFYF